MAPLSSEAQSLGLPDIARREVDTLSRMEIAALIVAVLALVAAFASALYAKGANVRADKANTTADAALDLQSRMDAREREFRDVSWHAWWVLADGHPALRITNVGLTEAQGVTVVVPSPIPGQPRILGNLGHLGRGDSADITLHGTTMTEQHNVESLRRTMMFFNVHWSNPLGQVGVAEGVHVLDQGPTLR